MMEADMYSLRRVGYRFWPLISIRELGIIMQMYRVGHQRYDVTRRSGDELSTGMKEEEGIETERETVGSKRGELGEEG